MAKTDWQYDDLVTELDFNQLSEEINQKETIAGAQEKAEQAEQNSKDYTDGKVGDLEGVVGAHKADKANPHYVSPAQINAVHKEGDTMNGTLETTIEGEIFMNFMKLSPIPVSYERFVVLLHEIYDGSSLERNYCIGTLIAIRGSVNSNFRYVEARVSSISAYTNIRSLLINAGGRWIFKTCFFEGKRYMAVEVEPFSAPSIQRILFSGYARSSGEKLRAVSYYNDQTSTVLNEEVYSSLSDYIPDSRYFIEADDVRINNSSVVHLGNAGPFYKGGGSPEGVVTAPKGAIFQRTNGEASTTLYVKENGTGNTGWVAK